MLYNAPYSEFYPALNSATKLQKKQENSYSLKKTVILKNKTQQNYKNYENCENRNEIRFVESSEQNSENYENRKTLQGRQRKSTEKCK